MLDNNMSEISDLTYAALITISLPGDGESITVPVKLSPADSVPIDGQSKLLADCTLADLQAYAVELERDVWDAYEAIVLPVLDEDEKVAVEVVLISDPSEPVEEWAQQVLLLAAGDDDHAADVSDEEELVSKDLEEQEELLFSQEQNVFPTSILLPERTPLLDNRMTLSVPFGQTQEFLKDHYLIHYNIWQIEKKVYNHLEKLP